MHSMERVLTLTIIWLGWVHGKMCYLLVNDNGIRSHIIISLLHAVTNAVTYSFFCLTYYLYCVRTNPVSKVKLCSNVADLCSQDGELAILTVGFHSSPSWGKCLDSILKLATTISIPLPLHPPFMHILTSHSVLCNLCCWYSIIK